MGPNIPQHIAIIMDGNGRWARKRGLPRNYGHRQGIKTVTRVINACLEIGIKYLTLYTFSTENWRRPKREVEALMNLLGTYIDKKKGEVLKGKKIRITVIGRWWELPGDLPLKLESLMQESKKNKKLNVILAINYGGRREILDAVEKLLKSQSFPPNLKLEEEYFRKYLYASEIPDPDLIIRTAGEFRISNFLLWQSSYAEFYVTEKLWPDFGKADLIKAIKVYQRRRRKFGGI